MRLFRVPESWRGYMEMKIDFAAAGTRDVPECFAPFKGEGECWIIVCSPNDDVEALLKLRSGEAAA